MPKKDIEHSIDEKVPPYNWAPPEKAKLEKRQEHRIELFEDLEKAKKSAASDYGVRGKLKGVRMKQVSAFAGPTKSFHHSHPGPHAGDLEGLKRAVAFLRETFTAATRQPRGMNIAKPKGRVKIEETLRKAYLGNETGQETIRNALGAPPTHASAPSFQEAETFLRLELGFDVIVKKIYELCFAINTAIEKKKGYQLAKKNYVNYLKNLNNSNPTGAEVNPAESLGYGKALKWVFVDPVIQEVNGGTARITAVTIVGEWVGGTHLSSNGVAIKH